MTALITGASTGLGHDMAVYLSKLGYDLILVARSKDKLQQLKKTLPVRVKVIAADLSKTENAVNIFRACKDMKIDLLINNAGIGEVGSFEKTSLKKETDLINLNVTALHILTKLFYKIIKSPSYIVISVIFLYN